MIIGVKGKYYDSNDQPVTVHLTKGERLQISEMPDEAIGFFTVCPSDDQGVIDEGFEIHEMIKERLREEGRL